MKIKPIVGLEIHIQIKTKTKAFCSCSTNYFQAEANTHVCPVCFGLPGALPVPNQELINRAILLGLALDPNHNGQNLAMLSQFDRKNYFYPDLPKGYQISQYYKPIITAGEIKISKKTIHIAEAHIEEDAAKSIHETGQTLIDYNKSGMPLFEIVSKPEMDSGEEAEEYAKNIQQLIRYLEISDADIEKGSMRVEPTVNLQITTDDSQTVYTPLVEIKNIASLKFAKAAIEYEIKRQENDWRQTGITKSSSNKTTRGWDSQKNQTYLQRDKEGAADYRYFPEPDIPPIVLTNELIEFQKSKLPELPEAKINRYLSYSLSPVDAKILAEDKGFANKFDAILGNSPDPDFAKFVANRFLGSAKPVIEASMNLPNAQLFRDGYQAVISKQASANAINEAILQSLKTGQPLSYVSQSTDIEGIQQIVKQILGQNPKAIADYQKNPNSIGFLMGQVIKASNGQANPQIAKQLLEQELNQ